MQLHFLNPNYHVILIHYPLGVFLLGVLLQLLAWHKGGLRTAANWMVMLGAFLSLPAVTSGIYALYQVAESQGIAPGSDVYVMMRNHVWFQSCSTLLAVICCVIGLGASDRMRQKLRIPLVLGVLIAGGGMVSGAWPGGEAVYTHGVAVQVIDSESETSKPKQPKLDYHRIANYYVGGEEQIHFILAGFALAAAFAALGLSIRKLNTHRDEERRHESDALLLRQAAAGRGKRPTDDLNVIRSLNPETDFGTDPTLVPAGRWWLLATLVTLLVATSGYWIMSRSHFAEPRGWDNFVKHLHLDDVKAAKLTEPKSWNISRHLAHAVLGSLMIIIALIMAIVARFAPRRPVLLGFFATLMILVVSGQVWMGIALTFDSEGPLWRFQPNGAKIDDTSAASTPDTSSAALTPATPDASQTPAPATPALTPAPDPAPAPAPTPAPNPTPAPVPESKPAPAPEVPVPTPAPAPEPKPAPAPAPEVKPAPAPAPEAKPTPTPEVKPAPAPTPPPAPAPEAKPAPAPESTPTPAPTPAPAPAPESKPVPAPAPETAPPPPPAPTTDKPATDQTPKPADSTPPPPPPAPSNPKL